jgi:serine/threonine-protein kinase
VDRLRLERQLKKAGLDGGAVITLADAPQFRGGSWGPDGTILFNRGRSGLFRVPADGGEAQEVTKLDPARREGGHRWPQHLPGGRAALLAVTSEAFEHDVAVVELETGRTRVLVPNAGSPSWSPTGHVLFGRAGVV